MRPSVAALLAAVLAPAVVTPAVNAGITVLLADRGANKIWRLTDTSGDGVIQSGEITVWYDETNVAGTGLADNLNAFFISPDGTVIGGDQVLRVYYRFKDLNNDGDALDLGESALIASTPNVSGASTTFPAGGAFAANGDVLIVNAGNANGCDAIYRCRDTDIDGQWMSLGEIMPVVADAPAGFVTCNGDYSPQEIVLGADGAGYLRNSFAGGHGVYRFVDLDNNGRADDSTEEFSRWYIGASAGFAIEPDLSRPGSLYYHTLTSPAIDQIYRLTDTTDDGVHAADLAELVFSTAETGFTSVDILCLPGGDVLFSDNSGKRIIRLRDNDCDGLFTSLGERTDFLPMGSPGIIDVRQIVLLPTPPECGTSDYNGDGDFGTDADIEAFFRCLGGNCCGVAFPYGSDFNADGDFGTDQDIESFFRVLGGGNC
jgi:hypothetical protein